MAGQGNPALGRLTQAANRVVADNAKAFRQLTGEGLSLEERAKRPWDFPAKEAVTRRIAQEELDRAGGGHNDIRDAMRHAQWSQRTAQAVGPLYAEVAGIAHEAKNLADSIASHGTHGPYDTVGRNPMPTPGETMSESLMDLRNNAEGRRAAREGRPIDMQRLQTAPKQTVMGALVYQPRSGLTFSARR